MREDGGMSEKLALRGGPKAMTRPEQIAAASRWPVFGAEEQAAVQAVLEKGAGYEEIAEFEKEFAAFTGSRYALASCNGTSAIHTAYFAVGVKPGDEVITSA